MERRIKNDSALYLDKEKRKLYPNIDTTLPSSSGIQVMMLAPYLATLSAAPFKSYVDSSLTYSQKAGDSFCSLIRLYNVIRPGIISLDR